jgi:TIR domain
VIQPSKGVFLSYASEDAGVAKRICDALRVAGIEVWFDQNRPGSGSWPGDLVSPTADSHETGYHLFKSYTGA